MVTFEEHINGILKQILESFHKLENLNDKPGGLEIIKIESLKINGFFKVTIKKLESSQTHSDNYIKLSKRIRNYLDNYEFNREIEMISNLYSNDPNRLKNIRLKIIESLQDKKLMELVEIILKS